MDEEGDRRTRWDWKRVIALALVILAEIGVVLLLPSQQSVRADNERSVNTTIRNLCSVEADFRTNDRDGNGINDYWTGDVAGLFRFGLIDRAIAEADARPLKPLVPRPIPYKGYYFIAMKMDESETPSEELQQDTDKKSGKVHHLGKFGFCAYPAKPGISARFYYIVNEGHCVLRRVVIAPEVFDYWPSDEEQRHYWGLGD